MTQTQNDMKTLKNITSTTGFTSYNYKLESAIEGVVNLVYTNLDTLITAIKSNGQEGDIVKITSQNKPNWIGEIVEL